MRRFLVLIPYALALVVILGLSNIVEAQSDPTLRIFLPFVTKPEERPTPTATSTSTSTATQQPTQVPSATPTRVPTQSATASATSVPTQAATPTATGVPTQAATTTSVPTQGATATATTPANQTVRVVSSRSYVTSSSRYVVGEVANDLPNSVYFVKLVARFYDANNQLVATEDGFTSLTETRPGQRNPFKLLLSNAPASITRYDLQVSFNATSSLNYEPITVISQLVRDNFGVEVFGEVRNDQPQEQRPDEVVVTFYDAAGNVLDTDFSFPTSRTLAPGATSIYRITTFDSFTYDRFVVQAEGFISSSQTPTPTPAARIRIVSSRSDVSSNTRNVVGEVINEGSSPAYSIEIAARFYDGNNQLVGVADANTYLTETRPGQRNPFNISLNNTPPSVARYDLQFSFTATSSLDYEPINILSQQVRDNFGIEVFGEVRNDQTREMRSVTVAVTFYDAAGNVLATDFGFPSSTTLAAGATSPYRITTFESFTYDRFVVQAEGYFVP